MTRTHAARQLLALGPLSFGQFAEITGWPVAVSRSVLTYLVDQLGQVSRRDGVYLLNDGQELPDVRQLDAKDHAKHGGASAGELRAQTAMGVPSTAADMRATQAGCCGRCSRSGCLAGEGVSA